MQDRNKQQHACYYEKYYKRRTIGLPANGAHHRVTTNTPLKNHEEDLNQIGAWAASVQQTTHSAGVASTEVALPTPTPSGASENVQTAKLTTYGHNINASNGQPGNTSSPAPAWTLNLPTAAASVDARRKSVTVVLPASQA
jgi:hypothetical protein